MAFEIMLDANIILDLTLKRTAERNDLTKIYESIVWGKCNCFITTSIIQICSYWMEKAIGIKHTRTTLITILEHVKVIDAEHDEVVRALHSEMRDFEDALQYYTALHHELDCIVSRDKQFTKSALPKLPVYHPKTFITTYLS